LIPAAANFKGYRIIAADGVKGELPDTPGIMKKYKLSKISIVSHISCSCFILCFKLQIY